MAWKSEIIPSWLENQLPDSADEQATLYHLVDFSCCSRRAVFRAIEGGRLRLSGGLAKNSLIGL